MGENHFAPAPTAVYGVVLLLAAIASWILLRTILAAHAGALYVTVAPHLADS